MVRAKLHLSNILLAILGAIFVIILVLLPVHAFLSTWLGSVFGDLLIWKSWKEILLCFAAFIVAWLCVLRPDVAAKVWRSKINKIILIYVVLNIVMAFFSTASSGAVIAGLLLNLRFLAMFVLAEVLVAANPTWLAKIKTWMSPWLIGVAIFISAVAILQVTVLPRDFLTNFGYNKDTTIAPFMVVDQNPDALRAFATMRGPNTLATYLVLPLVLVLYIWLDDRKKWWALGVGGLIIVALALTQSRAGWLGALLAVIVLAYAMLPKAKVIRWLKILAIPLVLTGALILWLATTVPAVRLVVFHSGGNTQDESLLEGSSQLHLQYTVNGIIQVIDHPLGQGVGTSGPASYYNTNSSPVIPEDYYVQLGQELGILGLAIFIWMVITAAKGLYSKRKWQISLFASLIGISLICIFMHGWADDPTAMTWWALAGLFIDNSKPEKYN